MRGEIKRIEYGPKFLRSFGKLSRIVQEKAETKERIFKVNAFDSRLDTHKLHGKDNGRWAYSVDYEYRIKFIFLDDNDGVLYLDIGTHDEIYR